MEDKGATAYFPAVKICGVLFFIKTINLKEGDGRHSDPNKGNVLQPPSHNPTPEVKCLVSLIHDPISDPEDTFPNPGCEARVFEWGLL